MTKNNCQLPKEIYITIKTKQNLKTIKKNIKEQTIVYTIMLDLPISKNFLEALYTKRFNTLYINHIRKKKAQSHTKTHLL